MFDNIEKIARFIYNEIYYILLAWFEEHKIVLSILWSTSTEQEILH